MSFQLIGRELDVSIIILGPFMLPDVTNETKTVQVEIISVH